MWPLSALEGKHLSPLRIVAIAAAVLAGIGIFILPQYLLAQPAPGAAASSPDRAATERIVRDYLLANPEILREMAEKLRTKDEAKAESARLGDEVRTLQEERKQVRSRIEKLLGQIDQLSVP